MTRTRLPRATETPSDPGGSAPTSTPRRDEPEVRPTRLGGRGSSGGRVRPNQVPRWWWCRTSVCCRLNPGGAVLTEGSTVEQSASVESILREREHVGLWVNSKALAVRWRSGCADPSYTRSTTHFPRALIRRHGGAFNVASRRTAASFWRLCGDDPQGKLNEKV